MKGILCIRLVICVHLLSITKGKNGARSSFVHTNELLAPLHVYMDCIWYIISAICFLQALQMQSLSAPQETMIP